VSIAIVILNYNGKPFLEKYLPGIIEFQPANSKIYIADNASTDDSVSYIQSEYPDLMVLHAEINTGFAGGYQWALRLINEEFYIILNSDVQVQDDWITPIVTYMQSNLHIAACQPKILSLKEPMMLEHAGAAGGWIDLLGYPFCKGRIFGTVEKDLGQYDQISPIFWASGAAMVIRSADYWAAGGFDTDFFAHMEEIDLCYRLQKMGKDIMSFPASKVYHLGGGTLQYGSPQKTFLNFRNGLFLLLKNKSIISLIILIPIRMVLDGIAALLFLSEGKSDHFTAVFKAHISFYGMFGMMYRKRKEVAAITDKKHLLKGIFKGSIVFNYYIKGNRHFYLLGTGKKMI
jgi:GT2 family glycosyltransferase